MKKLLFLVLLLVPISLSAGEVFTTNASAKSMVRYYSGVGSTELLPDSVLRLFVSTAIVNTSVEAGGVEQLVRISTVADQEMYELPDSIVAVLFTTLITSEGGTYVIRAGYPQYYDRFNLPRLGSADDDLSLDDGSVPNEYNYWADTLQLLPAPIHDDDTLYLKCFVEHKADTTAAGTIDFTHPDFTTAAIFLATHYALLSVDEFERATAYLNLYTTKKQELKATYQRRMDVQPTVKE